MKIGITERGDAGINLSWVSKVNTVDGMILITKNLTETFCLQVLDLYNKGYKIIVHCTCTGYGNSSLEPNVPDYKTQLKHLAYLIDMGFPADNCVLRIDPIFPSEKGLNRVREVINYFISLNTGVTRIRISIVDEYKHVKERYRQHGWNPLYGDNFGPSNEQVEMVANLLNAYAFTYEVCAEDYLAKRLRDSMIIGCISPKDLRIMGIPYANSNELSINPQNRKGCHCLSCKTELLTDRKQCPNGCVYCFWKGGK